MKECSIICWWGRDLTTASGTTRNLGPREDPSRGILQLAETRLPLRLVYMPGEWEVRDMAHVPAGRRGAFGGGSNLRRILARESPDLSTKGTVWGAASTDDHGAAIYIEARSPLPRTVESLRRAGLRIDGAWPLPLLLGESLQGASARGSLSLIASANRAVVAWTTPSGRRGLRGFEGDDFARESIAALQGARARFDEGERPSGWLSIEAGAFEEELRETGTEFGLTEISFAELLCRVRLFACDDPGNLLLKAGWSAHRNLHRIVIASSGLAAASLFAGHAWVERSRKAASDLEALGKQSHQRDHDAEASAGAAKRIKTSEMDRERELIASPSQAHYELLMALARCASGPEYLESISSEGSAFAVTARKQESPPLAAQSPPGFRSALSAPSLPWTISGTSPVATDERFTLSGVFIHPPESPPFGALANDPFDQAASRLAAAVERLPTPAEFEHLQLRWNPRWKVTTLPAQRLSRSEIRSYELDFEHAVLGDWPDIAESLKEFCNQPGLTIERLRLAASSEHANEFVQAEVRLMVRLRSP